MTGLALLTVLGVRRSGGFPLLAFGARVAPLLLFIIAGLAATLSASFTCPGRPKWSLASPLGGWARCSSAEG